MKRRKNTVKVYRKRSVRRDKVNVVPGLRKVIGIILLVFICIFVYVWLNLSVVEKGYLLSAKKSERGNLEKKNKELKLEVTELKSLDRIEKIAREKLQLVEPKENEIVWVSR